MEYLLTSTYKAGNNCMKEKLSIRDLEIKGKKVLLRVDFNVPLEKGIIMDDSRIVASLPTIHYILDQGGSVILLSHLGRPNGKIDPKLSLRPIAKHLSQLLLKPVKMANDCCGPEVKKLSEELKPGEVLLLENLRFHPGEEKPEKESNFASSLAELGNLYVDDAFGVAHRSHASTTTLPRFFPGQAAAGFLIEKEIDYLGLHIKNPNRPFCAILGGAKISTKFKVIEALMQKADILLIGGAMANTFFLAENIPVGKSLVEKNFVSVAREIMDVGRQSRCRLLLPEDVVVTRRVEPNAHHEVIKIKGGIPDDMLIVDIGPETVKKYAQEIKKAATVFWNGPLGVFECPPYDQGSREIAMALSRLQGTAITIIGGGDTIAAIDRVGVTQTFSHISTGGGATLEYIEFGELPGIQALTSKSMLIGKK